MKEAVKEATEAMQEEIVTTILSMGFERETVFELLKERRLRREPMFTEAITLLEALEKFQAEQAAEASSPQQPAPTEDTPGTSAQPAHEEPMDTHTGQPEQTAASYEKRVKELQDEKSCKICLDKTIDCVIQPCGHLCACLECARALKKCPVCRVKITEIIKVYRS